VSLAPGRATSGGDPYSVPAVQDTNPDPNIVETTLIAEKANVDIGNGVTAHAETFNGSIPGPTFHLKVGDTVIVHYENHLDGKSGIHWHGVELANEMDGTPFTQNQVPPGGTFLYKFTVSRPGMFWYHPHHHLSTNQVFRGLYGMIIVDDPNEAALQASGTLPPPADTKPIVLSDTTVCKAGSNMAATYPMNAPHISGASPFPAQAPPTPKDLCETSPIDDEGAPKPTPYNENDIPAIQTAASKGRTNEGQTVLTNGKNVGARGGDQTNPGALDPNAAKLDVQAGQGLRLQILNASTIRYMRLRLTDNGGLLIPLFRVGGEGGLLDNAVIEGNAQPPSGFDTGYVLGEILIPPGSRADIVAAIPSGSTGVDTLWTEDYKRTGQGTLYANTATVPVMHLNVTGDAPLPYSIGAGTPLRAATGNPVEHLGAATGNLLDPATFNPAKMGKSAQNIQLTSVANNQLGVDNVFGTHVTGDYTDAGHLGSSRYAKEGDILQLSVENATGAHHPFHLHGFSIQPISLTKPGGPNFTWTYNEFRDNVDIPAGYTLNFRVRLDPRPQPDGVTPGGALGRWVFHCHIFFHAENGMLSELVVVPGSGNERPNVNADSSGVEVSQGATATMTGTFKDPDPGDAVTLTSSVGTVTPTGATTWSWTFPTGTSNSQIVYITATDAGGHKGQIPFALQVDNTPPVLAVPGAQTVKRGATPNITVSATDPDAVDTVAVSATGLPAGLTLQDNGDRTAKVVGAVIAPVGVYTATISANDGHNAAVTAPLQITVAKAPLTAVVEHPERLVKKAVTVGCLLDHAALKSCRVDVLVGGKRVGRSTKTLPKTGKSLTNVRVVLSRSTRRKVARSLAGVPVKVSLLARTFDVPALTATAKTRVVAPRVVTSLRSGGFAAGSATLTKRARAYLAGVAKTVGRARRVECSAPSPTLSLSTGRAKAVCGFLKQGGLKAPKFSALGSTRARPSIAVAIIR
jgi:FtsP/CotA-like multicopper oxidase with cupredoxin domain